VIRRAHCSERKYGGSPAAGLSEPQITRYEIGRGCGFDVDFADYQGTFVVWGTARNQVDGYGNAVSPPVGEWIGTRLRAALHGEAAA
jgi:hypothetical protein